MLYFKRNITCASKCVRYFEGTLKQFNAPSARMLQTNQHIESSQPQIPHKESESSFCPSAMHNNMATQNKMREGSHHVHAETKLKETDQPTRTQTDMSCTSFSLCLTQDSSGSHNIYHGLMQFLAQHFQGHVTALCHLCQLPILQEKKDLVARPMQPDDVHNASLHALPSREALEDAPSSSDQASPSLSHNGLFGQPNFHSSPKPGT